MRLLDLFCCAGGAAVGYQRAGFEVVGVDHEPQPNYPFEFHQAEAMDFPLDGFDAIHASPPCQSFTAYRRKDPTTIGDKALDLIACIRSRLQATGVPFIIENVVGAPLALDAITLCGSSFGLDLQRHRLFETNWPVVAPPCNHAWQTPRFPCAGNRQNLRKTVEVGAYRCRPLAKDAMGIDWMTLEELSQAIPPVYTEFIGRQMYAYVRANRGLAVS